MTTPSCGPQKRPTDPTTSTRYPTDNRSANGIRKTRVNRNPKEVALKQLTARRGEDDDDLAWARQSVPVWSPLRGEEQTILPSCWLHEEKDQEDDVRHGQDSIEVASMIDNNGVCLNAEEEPDSRCSIDPVHLGTEETHIPSNVDEDERCTHFEAQLEEVLHISLSEYDGGLGEVDMAFARNGIQLCNDGD